MPNQRTALLKALRVMKSALEYGKKQIRPGRNEQAIAELLKTYLKKCGYASPAFDFIIAAGEKAYFPHHIPGKQMIQKGDMVVVDFGVQTRVGCTDITRTFFLGKPNAKARKYYSYVLRAQDKAIKKIQSQVPCKNVDAAARQYLSARGLVKEFRHSTGHGVGAKVHQRPRISKRSSSILQEGDIITIEPGVYIKGWGGIRIEDMVEVKKNGSGVLSHMIPKDLQSMIIA
ncbi:M24 family metallopeptidase [Patescibacteria group bacterium]